MVDVEKLRAQIPACQRVVYLNSGWSGPSPRRVLDAITERLEYESALGPTTAEVVASKQQLQEETTAEAAALLNASPDEVFLTQNTTEGINIVLSGLPWREGDEIVTCDLEHSSVLVPAYHLQSRGVRVRVVHVEPAASWEEIVQSLSEAFTPRTRMVFLSHIEYTSGLRMPLEQLSALCRPRGIWLLADGAQTAGHIALDMGRLGVDFYATTGHKWLLGPDGAGVLFIRRELIPEVQPTFVSSHAVASYDTEGDFLPNPSTMAKFGLTTSSTALRAGFLEAIRLARETGLDAIEGHNLALAARAKQALSEVPGVRILSPLEGPGACGLATFAVDGVAPDALVARLWEEERVVARSIRELGGAVRFSLHAFNTEAEVATAVGVVARAAQQAGRA